MTKYIALLRGINVGGHKKFLKVDQLNVLTSLNFKNPSVYLHTGNWLFESKEPKNTLTQKISKVITINCGWEVPVLVVSLSEIKTILKNCPFTEEKMRQSYFIMLSKKPIKELVTKANKITYSNEEIVIKDKCLYYFSSHGYGNTKFSMNTFEKILQVSATSRNYKTMQKLVDLSS